MVEVDASEFTILRDHGLSEFACIEKCGFCCLCQPELSNEELKRMRKDARIREAIVDELITGRKAHGFKLQGKAGACAHLSKRACMIYEGRPRFCEQFPFHIYLSIRAQLTADLSCRGLWPGDADGRAIGEKKDMETIARMTLERYPKASFMQKFNNARANYKAFKENAKDAGVYVDEMAIRDAISEIGPSFFSKNGLERLVAAGEDFELTGSVEPSNIARRALETPSHYDADELVREAITYSLNVPIETAPIFLSHSLEWQVFRDDGGMITVRTLDEHGRLGEARPTGLAISDFSFGFEREERKMLEWYLRVLTNRDAIYGNVALKVAGEDYKVSVPQMYFSTISDYMLDLSWRTWMFRRLGCAYPAKEAIIASDMDFMDADTLGNVI